MTWERLTELTVSANWQYTPLIESALGYVRLKHSTTGNYSRLLMAQAQVLTAKPVEFYDFQSTFAKRDYDIFEFRSPPFFDDRRLGFKVIRASGMVAEWSVLIEVNTMPLSNPSAPNYPVSAAAAGTTVASSVTVVPLLAANPLRKGATIWNASTAMLYIDLGATTTTAAYAAQLAPGGYYEAPFGYTGVISGLWAAANGNALVREFV